MAGGMTLTPRPATAMILFASDLHLSSSTPGIVHLFLDFLAGPARRAEALYLLGDIFEYWPGDDALDDPDDSIAATFAAALRRLTDSGVEVGFIAGNRDFLIGDRFATATGIRLLPDPFVLSLPNWQFVLAHGDQLCTDDTAYQAFRAEVRKPDWCARFLAKSLAERRQIITALRRQSEVAKRDKAARSPELMDVSPAATDDFLRTHGYATLIHGHTHRPARHDHIVDGIHCERWVLADWHEDDGCGRGDYLAWDGTQLVRNPLP